MCIDILRNPTKSLVDAKKRKRYGKSVIAAVESSVIVAVAVAIVLAKTGLIASLLLISSISVFLIVFVAILFLGLAINISSVTLGGKGKYYEGLTIVAYSMVPMSVGVLVAALLSLAPFTIVLQFIVAALSFALGISMLYRGVKDLYGTDMVTSFVIISVVTLSVIAAMYMAVGISLVGRAAQLAAQVI